MADKVIRLPRFLTHEGREERQRDRIRRLTYQAMGPEDHEPTPSETRRMRSARRQLGLDPNEDLPFAGR